ncbi:MAG: glyoxylate/hydroxypyruvate reductase A [Rhodospirillaceae bacterium]|nr:MAG: glyoxylate/hydroxypyruvate reductase A [Rhodospirillaceae bacterium]
MTILYKSDPQRGRAWQALFAQQAPDLPFRIWPDIGDPNDVRYLAAWEPPPDIHKNFPNLQVIFSVGAGIDQFDLTQIPPSIRVVRMVEPGIRAGMMEYVVFATLTLHRHILDYIEAKRAARWNPIDLVDAAQRRIGVMGLGDLGKGVLTHLKAFGFPLYGWSRSPHHIDGVTCLAGAESLPDFLKNCDILICLLPLTPATRGILSRKIFDVLPAGAGLINVGRGGHLRDADLLAALASGQLSGAVLDVFGSEPLPEDHPFWRHPRILMTPHIASMTHVESGGQALLDNIRRHLAGQPMHGLIQRDRGY